MYRRLLVGFMDACYGNRSFGEFWGWCAREVFSQFVSSCNSECELGDVWGRHARGEAKDLVV